MKPTKRPATKRPVDPEKPAVTTLQVADLAQVQGGAMEAYVTTKGAKQGDT